jgi:hypothetical protein
LRQAAAFVVLQDLIELFSNKGFFDLKSGPRSAPEVKRYFEYSEASAIDNCQGHASSAVLAFSDLATFRRDVLARSVSAASQRAYWSVRTATMAAKQVRKVADANAVARASLLLEGLPSVEAVERDMKGAGDRDTAARTEAALQWLAIMSESLDGGRAKASVYSRGRARVLGSHPDECKEERGCDSSAVYLSRFSYCRSYYESSPEFVRALLDKYVPGPEQSQIGSRVGGSGGAVLPGALAIPAGTGRGFPSPLPACITEGQYLQGDEDKRRGAIAAGKLTAAAEAKIQELRNARAATDAQARALALADGQRALRASPRVDTDVFGISLGSVLTLPFCGAVGKAAESSKTCLLTDSNGSTSIHWGDGSLPDWAQYSLTTEIKGDVIVSVTIKFPSAPMPPTERVGIDWVGSLGAAAANAGAQEAYQDEMKKAPARVAKVQGQMKAKYGNPTRAEMRTFKNQETGVVVRRIEEREWFFPGLHVEYDADRYVDSVLIELESAFKARAESRRAREAAEPKL